ncbi:MAG: hypothetical protein WCY19_07205 [Candidatus Gastranaerophilaceae bacterium]
MKIYVKLLFLIFVFLLLQITCEAQSQYSDNISKIEKSLFNMEYNAQSDEIRLNRIEENIYGTSSAEPIAIRINKLSKDLSSDVIGQEIKPKKDSFLEDDEIIATKPAEDMDFSVINNLEKKVFQYEFKTVDISHRLSALEGHVFKKSYLADDLSTRINRLKAAIMYQKFPVTDDKNEQTPTLIVNSNRQRGKQESASDIKLVSLEKSVLSTSFPDEKSSDRLARLEAKVFDSTFADDDNQTRLNRIEGAYQAKASSKKYKSNRASQRTATAIQIGTILLMILPLLL